MFSLASVYIACTIFGAGVTVVDMLGILGDLFHESGGGDHGSGHGGHDGGHGDHAGFHGDHDSGHGDDAGFHGDHGGGGYGDHGGFHGDHGGGHGDHADGLGEHTGGHGDHGDHTGDHGVYPGAHSTTHAIVTHDDKGSVSAHETYIDRNVLGQMLSIARSLVHFSVGFGPVGLFAVATGEGAVASLAWSVPVGLVAMVGGRLLRRVQRQRLDSQLTDADMIMERGEVLVSIGQGQIGKVRLLVEGVYAERYARAHDQTKSLPVGTPVRVVDVSNECVYVEEE